MGLFLNITKSQTMISKTKIIQHVTLDNKPKKIQYLGPGRDGAPLLEIKIQIAITKKALSDF